MKDDEQQRQQVSSSSHRKTASIPLFCLLALVGIKFFFAFIFLIIFLNQGHKGMNSTKYQHKPMKDVIGTNLGAFGKTGA
jgi:hypothetical protein